jgi:small subunit ribosomal protein S8
MVTTDPIADFLNRITTAGSAGKDTVLIPFSKMKMSIADILAKEGYIASVAKRGKKVKKYIEAELSYLDREPRIQGVTRVSKPSRRMYVGVSDLRPVKNGRGMWVISTPKGIMTDKEARKEKVGGEALFKIW